MFALFSLVAVWSGHTSVPVLLTVPTTLSLLCWELLLIGVRKRRRLLMGGAIGLALVPVLTVAALIYGLHAREKAELRSQCLAGRSPGLGQALLGMLPEADLVSSGSKFSTLAGLFPRKKMRDLRKRLLADYDQMVRTPGFDGIGNVAAMSALSADPRHYFVYVPKGLVVGPETPMLVCLHGAGGNFALYAWWWCELAISRQCILVCPSYDNGAWWQQPGTDFALAVLDEVRSHYGCAEGAVLLLGLSNGAVGAWSVAAARPDLFSGICCVSGTHERDRDLQACRSIPSLLIHGRDDKMIPIDLARQTAAYLKNAGADTVLVEVPDADHFVLAKERPIILGEIDEWLARLQSQTRRASPAAQGSSSRRSSAAQRRIETRLRPSVLGLDTAPRATRPAHSVSRLSSTSRVVKAPTVAVYGKWETTVQIDVGEANPFDPTQISVVGILKHSSGEQHVVPGFWYQGYDYAVDAAARAERLTPTGEPGFGVRFSPPRTGEYAYHFEVTTPAGSKTIPGGVILAGPPEGKGPLKRGESSHYLETATGEGVFLIGQNVAWSTDEAPLDDLLRYVNEMADTGQNFLRLWHCTWCLGYEHEETGRYDLERAWKMDRLIEEAEKRGVYIMFCFDNAYDVREKKSPYWRSLGGDSKGISTREEFFTSPAARKAFQNRMRYAFARWGHSSAIGAWEFMNEMEYVVLGPLELNSAVRDRYFRPWLDDMSAFAKKWEGHGHLLSNSLAVDRIWDGMNRMPWLDLVQHHAYLNAWDTDGAGKALRNLSYISDYGKPYLLGEFGGAEAGVYGAKQNTVNLRDTRGIHLHNAIWASALSGACGTPLTWWWDTYVRPQKLYHHYAALSEFLQGTPWLDPTIRPLDLSTSNARVLVLRGDSWALVWAQNAAYAWENAQRLAELEPVGPLDVQLDEMAQGQYRVEWWDTIKATLTRTQEMKCTGGLSVSIPRITTDVALKVSLTQALE